MSVNIETLSTKELSDLISKANQRKKVLAKRKPANQVKAAVAKFLKSVGWSFDELYGKTSGAKPAPATAAVCGRLIRNSSISTNSLPLF